LTFPTLIYFRASWLQQNMGTSILLFHYIFIPMKIIGWHDNINTFVLRYSVAHLVNSIGPTSLNRSLVVHISNCGFIVMNFHESHYKMSDMLSKLGPYFIVPELTGVGLVSNILHITLVLVYQCLYKWYICTSETLERNTFKRIIVFYITNNLNNPCIMNLMMHWYQ
jgi:hypothetical protein